MKKLLLIFTFFTLSQCIAQVTVNDLGKITYDELKKKEKGTPCEDNGKDELIYCLEGGMKVLYGFENEVLFGMFKLTYFTTKADAEKKLQKEIARSKSALGVAPSVFEEMTVFNSLDNKFSVIYSISFDQKSKSWIAQEMVVKI